MRLLHHTILLMCYYRVFDALRHKEYNIEYSCTVRNLYGRANLAERRE